MTINYNPNTPTAKLPYADWQIQFQQNFTQLNNAFSKNHIALDDATVASRGNHTYVQMPEQKNIPQTGAAEFTIFTKDVESQTDQVHFVYPGNSPVVQFTNYQIYSVPPTLLQTTFFTFLPGKILVYFGTFGPFQRVGNTPNILVLNPPVAKNIISVQFSISGNTPLYVPSYGISPWTQKEIITEIFVNPNFENKGPQPIIAVFYMVIANI
jgi:hypothetical protein